MLVSQGGGLYIATVATDVVGGVWDSPQNQNMDSHLQELILAAFSYAAPGGANPLLNIGTTDGGTTVNIQFTTDISSGDLATLATLVARASEYFVFLSGGSIVAQPIAPGVDAPTLTLNADGLTTKTLTIQMKNGDGTNSNGNGQTPVVTPQGLAPFSKPAAFNGSGQSSCVVGASGTSGFVSCAGTIGQMPPVPFNVQWNPIL